MRQDFPTRAAVLEAAAAALGAGAFDPDLALLKAANRGEPVMVRTLAGACSYWLVPLLIEDQVRGFVRVTLKGTIGAFGRYGGANCAWPDAAEAAETVAGLLVESETAAEPIFVHDGPPGREAWLVATSLGDAPARWLFVAPGGVYERPAGQLLDPDLE